MQKVIKFQHDHYFFPENQRLKNIMVYYAHNCGENAWVYGTMTRPAMWECGDDGRLYTLSNTQYQQ
jgi:hypothetical protein